MDQLVEGKANLVRMLEFVALTEDEKLLVTEGIELHQEQIEKLVDVPTPAGPTPRELEMQRRGEAKVIPIGTIRRVSTKPRDEEWAMSTPKGMKCVPRTLATGDKVLIYSDAEQIVYKCVTRFLLRSNSWSHPLRSLWHFRWQRPGHRL